jgi:multidrug resistance efflux pump
MTAPPKTLAALLTLAATLCGCGSGTPPPGNAPSPYVAVARGRVDVEGGLLNIAAPLEGRITRIAVQEGQQVHRGDLLLELDATKAQLEVAAAKAATGEAGAQLRSLEVQSAAAATRAARLRNAANAGAADGQAADDAQAQSAQLAAQKDMAQAARAAATARFEAARHAASLNHLRAPLDGQITQLLTQVGSQVSPGNGALLVLLPATPRIVRAELTDTRADSVKPGMSAQVSPEDDPDGGAKARVLRVSPVSGPPRLEDDPQRRGLEHAVECVLLLEGDSALRVGQRVLVRIGGKTP